MDSRRLARTAPVSSSGGGRPRTGGNVFVEKANVLEDIIAESEATAQGSRRYVRTQIVTEQPSDHRRSVGHHTVGVSGVDFKRSKPDANPHAESVAIQREKKEKKFPQILAAVDRSKSFLDEVDKEMSLAEEAKRNKIRRQFEDWNTNVHGEIQVLYTVAVIIFILYFKIFLIINSETYSNGCWRDGSKGAK